MKQICHAFDRRRRRARASAGVAHADDKKTIALVTNGAADFWTIAGRGMEKAQKEHPDYNIELIVTGRRPRPDSGANSTTCWRAASPASRSRSTTRRTRRKNSTRSPPRPCCSRPTATRRRASALAYIGTDNVAAGRQAGEEIKKALPNGGKIALFVGTLDADNARERVQGIKEALAGTKIGSVDVLHRPGRLRQGQEQHENTLASIPISR